MSDDLKALVPRIMVDFVQMKAFAADPLILEEGDGIRVRDVDGRWYIDGLSGVFVSALGHRNQRVIQAVTEQLNRLAFGAPLYATNPPALRLAKLLTEIAPPGFSTVKFFSGGSEANEAAFKLARQYHAQRGHGKKFKVISHYRGYHGGTGNALAASGAPYWRAVYEPHNTGFLHVPPPIVYRSPLGRTPSEVAQRCLALLEELIQLEGPETIAAVIAEPVMLSAGVHVPPPEYFPGVRALCDRYDIVLIFDEIITGFGRTGHLFGAQLVGAIPDLLSCGKGMSGGYAPLSAVLIQDRIAREFWGEPEEHVQYRGGHTYGANPVSCAAGLAAVSELLERGLIERSRTLGARLKARLEELAAKHEVIGDVRGAGLLVGVEFSADRRRQVPFPEALGFGNRVALAARRRGLLLRSAPWFIALAPPFIVTEAEIDEIAAIVDASIAEVSAAVLGTAPAAAAPGEPSQLRAL